MADYTALKKKVDELTVRVWPEEEIKARISKMVVDGIPKKKLDPKELLANKEKILDRIQLHAEQNNYMLKNCAQSTALALMEEFGLGNMEIIKALTPFPGIAGTGNVCGGITGSLIAFGLYFGSDDRFDNEAVSNTIGIAQQFITSFKEKIGYIYCSDILEKITIGFKLNPGESDEAMMKFAGEKGFEKCGLPPGIGSRLAAEFIIDSMK
jgi:C_GCAxxG_C_C family probable redox protein